MSRDFLYFFVRLWGVLLWASYGHTLSSIPWVCYYEDRAPLSAFSPYKLCVFDSSHHPSLIPLKQQDKILLGYLSLGEVASSRPYFEQIKKEGLLLQENKNWKGSYFVDIRDLRWSKRVIERLIPSILQAHFDGIFIDTLDNAEFLEEKDPQRYKGMKQAAIELVKAIRHNYPHIKIMLNRGFELLPDLASVIDMELAEVIYTQYDFEKKKYTYQSRQEYESTVALLKKIQEKHPRLQVYTLDYAKKEDLPTLKDIYKKQREQGFHPYVATLNLDEIVPEPPSIP